MPTRARLHAARRVTDHERRRLVRHSIRSGRPTAAIRAPGYRALRWRTALTAIHRHKDLPRRRVPGRVVRVVGEPIAGVAEGNVSAIFRLVGHDRLVTEPRFARRNQHPTPKHTTVPADVPDAREPGLQEHRNAQGNVERSGAPVPALVRDRSQTRLVARDRAKLEVAPGKDLVVDRGHEVVALYLRRKRGPLVRAHCANVDLAGT